MIRKWYALQYSSEKKCGLISFLRLWLNKCSLGYLFIFIVMFSYSARFSFSFAILKEYFFLFIPFSKKIDTFVFNKTLLDSFSFFPFFLFNRHAISYFQKECKKRDITANLLNSLMHLSILF